MTEVGAMGWRTHLVEFFSHMIGICQHCWIVACHFVKRFDGTIIARNMPSMRNTAKHMVEVAVGLHRGVRETCWTAGDMKQRHVVSLKIVKGWNISNTLRALGLRIGGGR